jgi:hypothetical protein
VQPAEDADRDIGEPVSPEHVEGARTNAASDDAAA